MSHSHFSPATIYPSLSYDDAVAAIAWLCTTFGFEKRLVVPGPDDPDAHCAHAVAAGAKLMQPLRDEEHDARGYMVQDLEGHHWYFGDYRPGACWDGAECAEPDS